MNELVIFLIRRVCSVAWVLFIVISLTFLMMRLTPGNPFSADRKIPENILRQLEARYKLDGTLQQQFFSYWKDVCRGDLRMSTKYQNRRVNEILAQTLPVSMTLGLCALALTLTLGILAGVLSALFHGYWLDRAAMMAALLGISIPVYVLAPLLILLAAIQWRWLPVAGWGSLDQLVLPVICLAVPFAAGVARLMRTSMLEVLQQDFVRTARAKGLSTSQVIRHHVLKVALLPIVSYSGPLAANLLTGSIVVEQIFQIPGVGPFFVNSVLNRDLFVVGGVVIVYSLLLITLNLAVDIAYTMLDRRIRLT